METVTSADGTTIAFDQLGSGPPLVLVSGASCDRAVDAGIAAALADHFTVLNYDRRGRGDSGDTPPYAVAREVEDLDALVDHTGGSASLHGFSSGALLALHAAAAGLPITRMTVLEPPFATEDETASQAAFTDGLRGQLASGGHDAALEFFLAAALREFLLG